MVEKKLYSNALSSRKTVAPRKLLHLSGAEQGIQERDENFDKRHIKEQSLRCHSAGLVGLPIIRINEDNDFLTSWC